MVRPSIDVQSLTGEDIVAQAEMLTVGVTNENLKRTQISVSFRFFSCIFLANMLKYKQAESKPLFKAF